MQDINRDSTFDENESMSLKENRQSVRSEVGTAFSELDKSRKIAVIFLAFFSVILFITWGVTTKNRINSPLNKEVSTEISNDIFQEEGIVNKDSDGDGLTDWEEENLYNTSPYLEDTDSDGILDNQEVGNGTDPNCKEGGVCFDDILQNEENTIKDKEILDLFIEENINLEIKEGVDEASFSEVLEGGSSADTLRKMLMDAGMEKELLNTISDEDLLSSYQEILQ